MIFCKVMNKLNAHAYIWALGIRFLAIDRKFSGQWNIYQLCINKKSGI